MSEVLVKSGGPLVGKLRPPSVEVQTPEPSVAA